MCKALILFMALAASTAQARHDEDPIPAATNVGKPVSCISLSDISETRIRSDKVIDFVMLGRNKVYRNELPYECPSLKFEERYLHRAFSNEMCSLDTITVLHSPGLWHGATCGLGQFQPIEYIKDAKPGGTTTPKAK